jgi:AraC family transcriptional regulator
MNKYYKEQFNKVLEYIHLNLDGKLDIKTLSKVAFISEFHFHRLIKSFLREAIGTYVKRIRVETGAKLLKYSDNSITDIAYKIGYESPTSFNKSFKKHFNVSPTQFRENPLISFENIKQKKWKTNFSISVEKKKIDNFKIICHPSKGILKPESIKLLWTDLIMYASQNQLINSKTKFVGIHWDDPSITNDDNIRYDACLSIENKPENNPENNPFPIKQISGGDYLCFTYRGDDKYLGDVYDQIFKDHILEKDIKLRNQPLFEQFLTQRETTPPKERITEIYIPV